LFAGCNRTGFIVCAYLIERCGFTPEAAMAAFADARAGGINHDNFRAELRSRYGAAARPSGATDAEPGAGGSENGHRRQGAFDAGADGTAEYDGDMLAGRCQTVDNDNLDDLAEALSPVVSTTTAPQLGR
jgi:hypothetical protein